MKRFARSAWTAVMLGVLVTGVQTLTAAPAANSYPECCEGYPFPDPTLCPVC